MDAESKVFVALQIIVTVRLTFYPKYLPSQPFFSRISKEHIKAITIVIVLQAFCNVVLLFFCVLFECFACLLFALF